MRVPRRITLLVGAAGLVTAGLAVPTAASAVTTAWAPAATAAIHPGVQTFSGAPDFLSGGAQCTANFIYQDATNVYIGQAAHCTSEGGSTATNGCDTPSLPLGTPVYIGGATRPGSLAYNSWLAMQSAGEANADACAYNDLALVRVDPADVPLVNPSIPVWGGPVAVDTASQSLGASVYSYGNSLLRGGITQLSPKTGISLQDAGNGWSHTVYLASPGVPGDSGSAVLDAQGEAYGVVSTVAIAPLTASNGLGDVGREIAYAQSHGVPGLTLVAGTEPFNPNAVPIG